MNVPFVGPSYNLISRPASVQRTVNLVPKLVEPGTERERWAFSDVPGLTNRYDAGAGFLLMQDGVSYVLNESGGRIRLEA